jgi:hypothetical protein
MSSAFVRLLIELAQDPLLERTFKADPEPMMASLDLTADERQALAARDPARIRALLTEIPADRDFLLLSWFASLTDDADAS